MSLAPVSSTTTKSVRALKDWSTSGLTATDIYTFLYSDRILESMRCCKVAGVAILTDF